jgi:hypothetical protein
MAGGVDQGEDPEFKPQYAKPKNKNLGTILYSLCSTWREGL